MRLSSESYTYSAKVIDARHNNLCPERCPEPVCNTEWSAELALRKSESLEIPTAVNQTVEQCNVNSTVR